MFKKAIAYATAVLLCFTGCSAAKYTDESETTAVEEEYVRPTKLTERFTCTPIESPNGFTPAVDSYPYYDKDSGEITVLFNKSEPSDSDDGKYNISYKLCRYDSDNNLIFVRDLDLCGDDSMYAANSVILADHIVYLCAESKGDGRLSYCLKSCGLDGEDGKTSATVDGLFDTYSDYGGFYISYMCVSNDGSIFLGTDTEVLALSYDFIKKFSVTTYNYITAMSLSNTGEVYIASFFENGSGIAKVDEETKALSDPIYPGDKVRQIFFSDGYDLYLTQDDGFYGCTVTENGCEVEMLMNYTSSDSTADSFTIVSVIDKDTVFGYEYGSDSYIPTCGIYKKAQDVDLSTITVLEIAAPEGIGRSTSAKIVAYNKAHSDTRIVINDYSRYSTDENYNGGIDRLITDMVTGQYKPDIIIGGMYSSLTDSIIAQGLFADMYPLIDEDDEISRDDILGGILRTFTTSDGQLWGLTSSYYLDTLVGRSDTLNGMTSWTLKEMIDFAKALPEGSSLTRALTQWSVTTTFKGMFNQFIDIENHTCDFENEEFIEILNFISSLPKDYDYKADKNADNLYEKYQIGKISLYNLYIRALNLFPMLKFALDTEDYTLIGYPTYGEYTSSGRLSFNNQFVITKFCENKAIAWDFIKSAVAPKMNYSQKLTNDDLPITRGSFNKLCRVMYGYEFEYYYGGGFYCHPADPKNPLTSEALETPGEVIRFTERDAEILLDYLDNECGSAVSESIPYEVSSIINEEISTFLGGAKTAGECAKVIQSRVSILLSEIS